MRPAGLSRSALHFSTGGTDRDLALALSKYDPPYRSRLRLEQLPAGSVFRDDNGQVFRLGPKPRSRYRCFTQPGVRECRVHSLARVEPVR